MDLITEKSEASLRKRNSFSTVSDASSTIVKRRRRCPSMLALNEQKINSDENQLQTSMPPLVDQASNNIVTTTTPTTPTTPTTVKRSSKFRGVSRCEKVIKVLRNLCSNKGTVLNFLMQYLEFRIFFPNAYISCLY